MGEFALIPSFHRTYYDYYLYLYLKLQTIIGG